MNRKLQIMVAALLALGTVGSISTRPTYAATDVVTTCSGDPTVFGSLPYEVANAAAFDTITFGQDCPSTSPIALSNVITVSRSVTIDGTGHNIVIDGGNATQLFTVKAQLTPTLYFTLSSVTLAHGSAQFGGAIYNGLGTVTISNSTLSGNSASSQGGAIYNGDGNVYISNSTLSGNSASSGGAIYNAGYVTISGSTLSGNSAFSGGAIYNNCCYGTVSITGSALSGNSASSQGGAIYTYDAVISITGSTLSGSSGGAIYNDGSTLSISSSTISGNSGAAVYNYTGTLTVNSSTISGNSGVAIYAYSGSQTITSSTLYGDAGGEIENNGNVSVGTSIVAGTGASNCLNQGFASITDMGYNLENDAAASCGFSGGHHDIVGQDPKLNALADNGGPTQTLALRSGSPAIGHIPVGATYQNCQPFVGCFGPIYTLCPSAGTTTDQRGDARPDDGETSCDIGAYEYSGPDQSPTTVSAVSGSGTYGGTAALTATLTSGTTPVSGESIAFTLDGSSVCGGSGQPTCPTTDNNGVATLQNASLAGIAAGSYPTAVGASFAGDSAYTASTATGALTVGIASQTITFGALPTHTYGDSPFTVSATASSGLPVSFSAGSTDQCTVSGTTVTITGAGSCTVTASQPGDANVTAAPAVSQSFSIAKASTVTTVTASANPSIVKQGVTFTVAVTSGAGTPGGTVTIKDGATTLASGIQLSATGSATLTTSALAAGTHSITASYSGSATFSSSVTSTPLSQQVRYNVKALSTGSLAIVLQLLDYNTTNVSASKLPVTAECVVPYSQTPPTACGATPVQTITKAFGFSNSYKGMGPAYSYSVNAHGLTKGQQYDLLVQTDGDPIWHAVPFTA